MANPALFNPSDMPEHYDSGTSYVASGVIKNTASHKLNGFLGFNSNASSQFIMIYDSATVPANGQGAKIILNVAGSSSFSWNAGGESGDKSAKFFKNGISWSNSSTAPTKTIGAADVWMSASYD